MKSSTVSAIHELADHFQSNRDLSYAKLLLTSYQNRPQELSNLTIGQYLDTYGNSLKQICNNHTKLGKQLLSAEYIHLKEILSAKTKQSQERLISRFQAVKPSFEEITAVVYEQQKARLDSLQQKTALASENRDSQELNRIRKLLSNGVWGCLERLNERLQKLRQLEEESCFS